MEQQPNDSASLAARVVALERAVRNLKRVVLALVLFAALCAAVLPQLQGSLLVLVIVLGAVLFVPAVMYVIDRFAAGKTAAPSEKATGDLK